MTAMDEHVVERFDGGEIVTVERGGIVMCYAIRWLGGRFQGYWNDRDDVRRFLRFAGWAVR